MEINNITFKQNPQLQKKVYNKPIKLPAETAQLTDKVTLPIGYYKNMFIANQNISQTSFKGVDLEPEIKLLKKGLSVICKETIDRYNHYDQTVSENLFSRGFIHHSLGFEAKEGDDFHNLKDPFFPTEWSAYFFNKNKTTVGGANLCTVYTQKMENSIDGWLEKFIETISKQKADGHNNLLDDLINSGEDIQRMKGHLGL